MAAEAPSRTLFVVDFAEQTHLADLEEFFRGAAPDGFLGARIRVDRNHSRVAFVEYEDPEAAGRAKLAVQPLALHQRNLNVFFSKNSNEKRPRSDDHDDNHGMRPKQPRPSYAPVDNDAGTLTQVCYSFLQGGVRPSPDHNSPRAAAALQLGLPPQIPADASSTLYVEGLPPDATDREMAHIFRPFPGYKSLRLKQSARGAFCFVEFESPPQALIAKTAVQGYPLDKARAPDTPLLRLEFAKARAKAHPES